MDLPLTIKETQEGLRGKKFTAVEVVEHYIERIDKYSKEYNIYLTVTSEEAYKKAKEIDKLLNVADKKALDTSPLFGAMFSYKDIYMTEGVRTTAASNVLKDYEKVLTALLTRSFLNGLAI